MKNNNTLITIKKTKKSQWLKTCSEILELDKLTNPKDKLQAIKVLKLVYALLLTNKARENYINELKRKVCKEYE